MKKIFSITLCLCVFIPASVMAKPRMRMESQIKLESNHEGEATLILFDLSPFISNTCFVEGLKVFNGTKNRITILWNDAKVNNSKLCFRGDSPSNINSPKSNENVYSMTGSTSWDVFPAGNISHYDNSLWPLYNPQTLKKKGGSRSVYITIPIMFSSEKIEVYKLEVTYQYVSE